MSATPPTFLGFTANTCSFQGEYGRQPIKFHRVLRRGGNEVGAAFRPSRKKWKEKKLLSFVSFDICVLFGLFIGCVLAFVFFFIIIGRVIHVLLAVAPGQT